MEGVILPEEKILRPYQKLLLEKCMLNNSIILLPTGTGKTLIAFWVINNLSAELLGPFPTCAKRTIFLAPTRVLVEQQHEEFQKFCLNPKLKSVALHGGNNVDFFTQEEWNEYFNKNHVLFFTPQVFNDIITKNFLSFFNINLVVFDECHHALQKKIDKHSNHPYRICMELHKEKKANSKIICLSATLFKSVTPSNVEKQLEALRNCYKANVYIGDSTSFSKEAFTYVISYDDSHYEGYCENVLLAYDSYGQAMKDIHDFLKNSKQEEKTLLDSFSVMVEKIDFILKTIGPWFAIEAIEIVLSKIINSVNSFQKKMFKYLRNIQDQIKIAFCLSVWSDEDMLRNAQPSERIEILFKILRAFPPNTRCLIFVQERIIANVIYRFIKKCSEALSDLPKYQNIKPGFFIGRTEIAEKIYKFDKNTENIRAMFDSGNVNLLVATSVLQEGIDVPTCKIVIRFDFPVDYSAFIQSRGRARCMDSFYYIMTDKPDKARKRLNDYIQIENILKKLPYDHGDVPEKLANFDCEIYKTKDGAILLEASSNNLLTNYLTYHHSNKESHYFLNEITNDDGRILYCYAFWYPSTSKKFGFEVGKNCTNRDDAKKSLSFKVCVNLIENGEIDSRLNVVKTSLIENLCPDSKEFEDSLKDNEFNTKTKSYPMTNSTYSQFIKDQELNQPKAVYSLYKVDFEKFSEKIDKSGKILKFGFLTPSYLPFDDQKFPICINQDVLEVNVSFLKQKRLSPNLNDYNLITFFSDHIFRNVNILETDFKYESFTDFKNKDRSDDFSTRKIFLVPLNDQNEIDFVIIHKIIEWKKITIQKKDNIENITLDKKIFALELNDDYVLTFAHSNTIRFFSIGSSERKDVADPMEKNKPTYKEFYKNQYKLDIHFNLLHMDELAKTLLRKKIHINKKEPRKDNSENSKRRNYFPIESAVVYPLKLSQLIMFNAWMAIHYRIEQYLKAHDLLEIIMDKIHVAKHKTNNNSLEIISNHIDSVQLYSTYRSINVNNIKKPICVYTNGNNIPANNFLDHSIQIGHVTMNDILNNSSCFFGVCTCFVENLDKPLWQYEDPIGKYSLKHSHFQIPEPWHIVQAMTVKKAGDVFDNEQLETIGDSFLKMTTCLYLYFQYPKYPEGRLTDIKNVIVSNQNLFYLAMKKDLTKFIFSNEIDFFKNWKPSFYNDNNVEQELKFKNIADCVEALMGAFLIHGSFDALIHFFSWLGLPAFDPSDFIVEDPVEILKNNIQIMIDETIRKEEMSWCLKFIENFDISRVVLEEYRTFKFNEVEEIIGYNFKNKFYLVQAFTHSSYTKLHRNSLYSEQQKNSIRINIFGSNERLEFIGDAIIDFLIVIKIFEANDQLRPGELTTIKSALVNNSFFSSIVVKFGLHSYLRYSSKKFDEDIIKYVNYIQNMMHVEQCQFLNMKTKDFQIEDSQKFISDIFEALIGAIYLDNGLNLDELWKVLYHLIRPEFELFMKKIPKNPISVVSNVYADRYEFSEVESDEEFGKKVTLSIYSDKEKTKLLRKYEGFSSSNKRLCLFSAAQKCLLDSKQISE